MLRLQKKSLKERFKDAALFGLVSAGVIGGLYYADNHRSVEQETQERLAQTIRGKANAAVDAEIARIAKDKAPVVRFNVQAQGEFDTAFFRDVVAPKAIQERKDENHQMAKAFLGSFAFSYLLSFLAFGRDDTDNKKKKPPENHP